MISYAQNYEDLILSRIFRDKPKGFYVDVGANHPVQDSVTWHFYQQGWRGINFEPNQVFYKQLLAQRPGDTNIPLGCSDVPGVVDFYEVIDTGLSTFSTDFMDIIEDLQLPIKKYSLSCTTLKDVFQEQQVKEIDFMSVDVEGFELKVLMGNDWQQFRPKVIVLEAVAPTKQSQITYTDYLPYLEEQGYALRYFDGINVFVSDTRAGSIEDACFYPPNVFDQFKQYKDVLANEKTRAHIDELQAQISALQHALEEKKVYTLQDLETMIHQTRSKKVASMLFKKWVKKNLK